MWMNVCVIETNVCPGLINKAYIPNPFVIAICVVAINACDSTGAMPLHLSCPAMYPQQHNVDPLHHMNMTVGVISIIDVVGPHELCESSGF